MPRFRSKLTGSIVNVPSAEALGTEYEPIADGETPTPEPPQPAAAPVEEPPEKPTRSSRK